MQIRPVNILVFMGGNFTLDQPRTIRELREQLQEMDRELAGWGDDAEVNTVVIHDGKIQVTLRNGLPQ